MVCCKKTRPFHQFLSERDEFLKTRGTTPFAKVFEINPLKNPAKLNYLSLSHTFLAKHVLLLSRANPSHYFVAEAPEGNFGFQIQKILHQPSSLLCHLEFLLRSIKAFFKFE